MTLTIVAMDPFENFLQFLDPELCTLTETIEKSGLRTLDFEYQFQDLKEDKQLFQMGNKIWIQGDTNIDDCLYVINTEVENSVYEGNYFKLPIEEVLVELNYAPLFSQTELTSGKGFDLHTTNGKKEVTVNFNALNYWFGAWFNIGVVQKCISTSAERIAVSGTTTLMELLRYIEEETGNVFVTRYEKDCLTNVIHRYLDFLNPITANKPWEFNIEYDFIPTTDYGGAKDENGNPVDDTYLDVEDEDDLVDTPDPVTIANLNVDNTVFRITDKDGEVLVDDEDNPIVWDCNDAGLTGNDNSVCLTLTGDSTGTFGLETKVKSYAVQAENTCDAITNGFVDIANDPDVTYTGSFDGGYFEMYDTVKDLVVFRTEINSRIGTVHEEILDFGFNLENIIFNTDESETYTAVSPVLTVDDDTTRTDMDTIINNWKSLAIGKGNTIPLVIEKVNVEAASLSAAKTALGEFNLQNNYWVRPLKPNDNTDSSTPTWEFYKATSYWRAPYTKKAGELHVRTDKAQDTVYKAINSKMDARNTRQFSVPKMGTVDSNEENKYLIYNEVVQYLQEHETPNISIDVDVANLRKGQFNNYQLHDKVYLKLPDSEELVTARVVETTKEAHDIAKNSIKLDNYSTQTIRTIPQETDLTASNVSIQAPDSGKVTCRLENIDYDAQDPEKNTQYPSNKLITFNIYEVDNGNETWTGKVYTKLTSATGYASIPVKFSPGDYIVEIIFTGDEIYNECSTRVKVNVHGYKNVKTVTKKKTVQKTKQKTTKKTQKLKKGYYWLYWTKTGRSPDDKHKLRSIARPSGKDYAKYDRNQLYDTIFKNYCPECKRTDVLNFVGNVAKEHAVKCARCGTIYCGVTGIEYYNGNKRLTTIKKPVKSNKSEYAKLVKGQQKYGQKKKEVKKKKVTSTKTRTNSNGIPKAIVKLAENIVEDSKGWAAAKKIAKWCDRWSYQYGLNFNRSVTSVLNHNGGNCCSMTRAMFVLMDAAGVTEYVTLKYVHVCCGPRGVGHVFGKIVHKQTGHWRYIDPCNSRGTWTGPIHGWGAPPGTQTTYSYGSTPF